MKLKNLLESTIKSAEGEISEDKLDRMISFVIDHYDISPEKFEEIKAAVVDDYKESDISAVTTRDIVEIVDASGIE